MRRVAATLALLIAGLLVAGGPVGAITFGQLDQGLHPQVGALIAEYTQPGDKRVLCSGSVIAPKVFLTAGHCTAFLESIGIKDVWVTFDSTFDPTKSPIIHGSYVTDPDYGYSGQGGRSDPHDLAVVLLDSSAPSPPVALPSLGLLDKLDLRSDTFTAVGYGTVREEKTKGPQAFFFDSTRRYALQTFLSLQKSWLTLSENPSTGSGGTCYGDSGGPHFLGGTSSNLQVAITVTGDAACRATDTTYRLDTESARAFLGKYVGLP